MWQSRLFWRVFLVCVSGNLLLTFAFVLLLTWGIEPFVVARVEERLRDTAVVLRGAAEGPLESGQRDALQLLVREMATHTDTRFTVIDGAGVVVADSHEDPRKMENHATRPEIRGAASQAGEGIDRRSSVTVGVPLLYLALKVERDRRVLGYVRVSAEMQRVESLTSMLRWIGTAVGVGVFTLATLLSYLVVRRIVQPLEQLTSAVSQFAVTGTAAPIQGASRDEVGVLSSAFNQMQETLAQRWDDLRSNNERLQGIMRSMEEGVLALDADERVVLANDAGRMLLELGDTEITGRRLWEVTRQRALRDAFLEAFPTGRPSVKEFETTGAVRRVLTLRATRLPGEPSPGLMMVMHDVTELRRLENLRRDFVANVSHELKTPLSSIKAYAETLRLGAIHDPDHNLGFVERIEEQAERLHQLIIDLLHLARVESGQQVYDITRVPMMVMVEATFKAYRSVAEARNVNLACEPPAQPVAVRADEEGVRTILNNLVDNAIKYTPANGRVTVRWRREANMVVLEVEDTGIGIARQHHARVFERFYRVDKARSRELGGTGLGLSIVKHLAGAFGGTVGIDSAPRHGSTFRVSLPVADVGGGDVSRGDNSRPDGGDFTVS